MWNAQVRISKLFIGFHQKPRTSQRLFCLEAEKFAMKNQSKLKDIGSLNLDIVGLDMNSNIFIRPSLCPYYKTLQFNCRNLKRQGLIKFVRTDNDGYIKIKTL